MLTLTNFTQFHRPHFRWIFFADNALQCSSHGPRITNRNKWCIALSERSHSIHSSKFANGTQYMQVFQIFAHYLCVPCELCLFETCVRYIQCETAAAKTSANKSSRAHSSFICRVYSSMAQVHFHPKKNRTQKQMRESSVRAESKTTN